MSLVSTHNVAPACDEERYYTYVFSSVDEDEIFLCIRMLDSTAVGHAIR